MMKRIPIFWIALFGLALLGLGLNWMFADVDLRRIDIANLLFAIDFRHWPAWYAVVLWGGAVLMLCDPLVAPAMKRTLFCTTGRRISLTLFLFILLLPMVARLVFIDGPPFLATLVRDGYWAALQLPFFKTLYDGAFDWFYYPVVELVLGGQWSWRLLISFFPLVLLVVFIVFVFTKKRR